MSVARKHLEANHIVFHPGLNEDMAATAVWGTQQNGMFPGARYDGIFSMWYRKGPGVDRSLDVIKLDVELFDRSGHKPRLTPAGATLLADVKGLLLKVDIVRARARGLGQGVELEIVLALDPQFQLPPLCRALGAMHHRYPTVALRILSTPLGASIDALLDGRCDLAISGIDLVHPAVET
jgi:hypothetical protein